MPDQTLDILLKVIADTGGSEQTLESLKKLKAELEDMKRQAYSAGVSTSGLDNELKQVDGALGRLSKQQKDSNKDLEVFNLRGREGREVMRAMNEIAPGLGTALKGVFNPELIGIIALVLALSKAVELIKEYKQKAEDAVKAARALWDEQNKAVSALKDSAEDYRNSLRRVVEDLEDVRKKDEEDLKILQQQWDLRIKLAGKDERATASLLRQKEEAVLEQLFQQRRGAITRRMEAGTEFEEAQKAVAAQATGAGAAQATAAKSWIEANKDKVDQAFKWLQQHGGVEKWQEEVTRRANEPSFMAGPSGPVKTAAGFAREQLEDAKVRQATLDAQKAAQEAIDAQARTLKALNDTQSAADAKLKKYIKEVQDATDNLERQKRETDQARQGRSAEALQGAGLKPFSVLGGTVLRDIQIQEDRQRAIAAERARLKAEGKPEYEIDRMAREGRLEAGRLDAESAQAIRELVTALRLKGQTQWQINQLFKDMGDLSKDQNAKIVEVLTALKQLKQQSKGLALQ